MKMQWNGLRLKKQENSITLAMSALIGSIIAGVTSAAAATANTVSQVKTNQQNQENLEKAWSRDDAQLQRAREDAQKAGFSPLAALSSNLTNTAPSQMQAPQFDSSGLVDSIQSGAHSYAQLKQQQPIIDEQVKAARLENDYQKATLNTRKLQNVANLTKTLKELDSMDLSNYEKATILRANGVDSQTLKGFLKHSNFKGDTIHENTGNKVLNDLQKAQTNLANRQSSLVVKQKALVEAQKLLTDYQATSESMDYSFWNTGTYTTKLPNISFKDDDVNKPVISWQEVKGTRKDIKNQLDMRLNQLKGFDTFAMFDDAFWKRLSTVFNIFK